MKFWKTSETLILNIRVLVMTRFEWASKLLAMVSTDTFANSASVGEWLPVIDLNIYLPWLNNFVCVSRLNLVHSSLGTHLQACFQKPSSRSWARSWCSFELENVVVTRCHTALWYLRLPWTHYILTSAFLFHRAYSSESTTNLRKPLNRFLVGGFPNDQRIMASHLHGFVCSYILLIH